MHNLPSSSENLPAISKAFCLDDPALPGHSDTAIQLVLIPMLNGKKCFASASLDGTIKIWDAATFDCLNTFHGHADGVSSLIFLPRANEPGWLISGGEDNLIKVWDLQTYQCIKTLQAHKNIVTALVVLMRSNAQPLLISGGDNSIKIWDLETSTNLMSLSGHTNIVTALHVLPAKQAGDPNWLISGDMHGIIKLWKLPYGRCVKTHQVDDHEIKTLITYSHPKLDMPDNNYILLSGSGGVTKKGKINLCTLYEYYSSVDDMVLNDSPFPIMPLQMYTAGINALAIIPAITENSSWLPETIAYYLPWKKQNKTPFNWLASAGDDHTIRIWELPGFHCVMTLQGHTYRVVSLLLLPQANGINWLVSSSADCTIKIWELPSGRCLKTLGGHSRSTILMPLSSTNLPDLNDDIVVSGDRTSIKVWDIASGKCAHSFGSHTSQLLVLPSYNGQRWLASIDDNDMRDPFIQIYDLLSMQHIKTLAGHSNGLSAITLQKQANGNTTLISATWNGEIKIWELPSGRCINTFHGDDDWLNNLLVLSNGNGKDILAVGGHYIQLLELPSGRCVNTLKEHEGTITALALLSYPNGKMCLVSGSHDCTIKLWELPSGRCLQTLQDHKSVVRFLLTLRDGRLLSISEDTTMRLWNTQNIQNIGNVRCTAIWRHSNWIRAVVETKGGKLIVCDAKNGILRIAGLPAINNAIETRSVAVQASPPPLPRDDFICPITQEIMEDPVMAADGHSYERAAIEKWLTQKLSSPITNDALRQTHLIPNHALRNSIKEWQKTVQKR